jgi:hypothetical protein
MRRVFPILLFAALLIAGYFAHASSFTKGRAVAPFTSALKPGDYIWHPEISPAGPVIVGRTPVGGSAPNLKQLSQEDGINPQFLANLRALVTPGTSLILTDASVDADTRSNSGFNVLTASNAR